MEIKLINSDKSIIIDEIDFNKINKYKWRISKRRHTNYAYSGSGNTLKILHRFIFDLQDKKLEVDHIDGNGLNNARNNIRIVTHRQNLLNKKPLNNKNSKGVDFYKNYNKWRARIIINNKQKTIGYYNKKIEAMQAYNEMAKKHYGIYAKLNYI